MLFIYFCVFFFFKQKTAYEMRISDWSSDVCSSDLIDADLVCDGRHLVQGGGVRPLQRVILQAAESRDGRVLLQQHDPRARPHRAPALVRLDPSRQQLQQRGLASTIPADQGQPVAFLDENENGRASCREVGWQYW